MTNFVLFLHNPLMNSKNILLLVPIVNNCQSFFVFFLFVILNEEFEYVLWVSEIALMVILKVWSVIEVL